MKKNVEMRKADWLLQDVIIKINTISREDFEKEIVKYVNVDQYLRWLAGAVLTQNYDGFVHNYALYRNGETGFLKSFHGTMMPHGGGMSMAEICRRIMCGYKGLIL